MSRKRFSAEQILSKLREAEVELAKGKCVAQVVRGLGVTEQTYYRWRKEYGGMKVEQAKCRKAVEHAVRHFHPRLSQRRASVSDADNNGRIHA